MIHSLFIIAISLKYRTSSYTFNAKAAESHYNGKEKKEKVDVSSVWLLWGYYFTLVLIK